MAIQNNLEAPITATSVADALKQYDAAAKSKKAAPKKAPASKPKVAPKKAKKVAPKKAKKAKAKEKAKAPRTFKAAVTGTTLKSRMVRISTELADFLTEQASKSDITVTEASRILVEGLLK